MDATTAVNAEYKWILPKAMMTFSALENGLKGSPTGQTPWLAADLEKRC
jgi:hypothetical protein